MKIAFVFSHYPDPRINKRIEVFKKKYEVYLIFWDRNQELQYKIENEDIENIKISISANYGSVLNRIIPTLEFGKNAISELNRIKPDLIYAGNLDMLYISQKYHKSEVIKPKIIYEIADLHGLIVDKHKSFTKRVIKLFLIGIEKKITKNIDVLVLTSEKFYDFYYSTFIPRQKVLIIPNMPKLKPFEYYQHKSKGKFTIGFIGAIRYKEQMKMLINAADNCGIRILFAGAGLDNEIEEICKDNRNIEYYGKYDYDSEIAQLYGKVDCVYSVYDADMNNVKVALPNKLYESIYCELPIIVAKETYLAKLVEELGVGIAVSHKDVTELEHALLRLSTDNEYYNSFRKLCKYHKENINTSKYDEKLLEKVNAVL